MRSLKMKSEAKYNANIKRQSSQGQLRHQYGMEARTQKQAHFMDYKWANLLILRHIIQIFRNTKQKHNQIDAIFTTIKYSKLST